MAVWGFICIGLGLWMASISARGDGTQQLKSKKSTQRNGQEPVVQEKHPSHLCAWKFDRKCGEDEADQESGEETKQTEKTTDDPKVTQSVTYTGEKGTTDDSQFTQTATQINLPEVSMLPYALGIPFSLFVLSGIALSMYYYRRRHSDEESSPQQAAQLSAVTTSHYDEVILHDDADNTEDSPRHQHVTMAAHSSASVKIHEAEGGSEEGQYRRLDRDGRKENNDAASHGDLYDHATSPQRTTSAPTGSNASQEESDVYNRLRRHPEKETVIDNVYDSTH